MDQVDQQSSGVRIEHAEHVQRAENASDMNGSFHLPAPSAPLALPVAANVSHERSSGKLAAWVRLCRPPTLLLGLAPAGAALGNRTARIAAASNLPVAFGAAGDVRRKYAG